MEIRLRTDADMDELVAVAERVRVADDYPIYEPELGLAWFLTTPEPIVAWVAVRDGAIVGHVALNATATPSAMRLMARIESSDPQAFVSRLLVDPDRRGERIGVALLEHATHWAADNGYALYLEAVDVPGGAPAMALYRAKGWQELGRIGFDLGGHGVEEVVFAAPPG